MRKIYFFLVVGVLLCVASASNAKVNPPTSKTAYGDAIIEFSGELLTMYTDHAEAQISFSGTTYDGLPVKGEGFLRFPGYLEEGAGMLSDWSITSMGLTLFTGNLATQSGDYVFDGMGRINFEGTVTTVMDTDGIMRYQLSGRGTLRWNGGDALY